MKKPFALLLLTALLVLLLLTQASALQLPGPLPPIDLPPIDLPPIDLPPIDLPDPIDLPPIDLPPIDLPEPIEQPPFDPGFKPKDPTLPQDPTPPKLPAPIDPGFKIPITPLNPLIPGGAPTPGTPGVTVPKTGKFVTSEGPMFLMYRGDLTKGYEMFTPLDLAVDGEYYVPLISNAMHKVGELKVSVKAGIVIATPLVPSGVTLSKDFMTFFPDIDAVTTIDPAKLKKVNVPFAIPVDVGKRFETDLRVLLYVNCAVKYKTSLAGVTPFSPEDQGYLERMYALIELMD